MGPRDAPLKKIQRAGGWKDVRTLERYIDLAETLRPENLSQHSPLREVKRDRRTRHRRK